MANSAAEKLKAQRQSHPLEVELAKLQKVLDALEECPPLWWAVRWFYQVRERRVREALEELMS